MRTLFCSVLGLLGGLIGWVLMQSGFHVFDALSTTEIAGMNSIKLNSFIYEGALIGLGLGMILQARASLWYHHDLVPILSKMFYGALSGTIIGLFCFSIGHVLQTWQFSPILSRMISWTLLGLFIVGSTELFHSHSEILWPLVISGGIGGIIGGGIFELLLLYNLSGPEHLYGLIMAGFSISLLLGIQENRVTSFALRVLSGKQEGQSFLLDQNKFTLGYGSKNDFILKGYAEVYDLHAYIYKKDKNVFIENIDASSEIFVNYRLIDQQQSMKKGDVIKIGTALMQYYEI